MALRAAVDFETLNARNSELAALHETAVGLLERLDVDACSPRSCRARCSLVGTPHGFLALVDPETDPLTDRGQARLAGAGRTGARRARRGRRRPRLGDEQHDRDRRLSRPGTAAQRASPSRSSTRPWRRAAPARPARSSASSASPTTSPAGRSAPDQVALVERFAQLAALALENARLYTALQQSEELHRRIVDCSTDLISVVDLEGTIVVISPSVFETLGVPAGGDGRDVLRAARAPGRPRRGRGRCSRTRCRARSRPRTSVSATPTAAGSSSRRSPA